ncbi:GNAT family N-acetyltransferase [Actinoallomurus acaciae]|uniref:GNAT family N-acetyltransferase n=1 Tax=Actinoallomurus acaciae TaxID=502577 RepID=A0ABV5YLP3_9ACTN
MIRAVRPEDAAALAAMFGRCSRETRYRRFHGPVTEIPAFYLRHCLDGRHRAFVAGPPGAGGLVGLASAGPVPGDPSVHEVGVLVEDAWQRRGVGGLLLARLFTDAHVAGVERVRLELCRSQPSLVAYVCAHMGVVASSASGCDVTVDVAVPAPPLNRRRSPASARAR